MDRRNAFKNLHINNRIFQFRQECSKGNTCFTNWPESHAGRWMSAQHYHNGKCTMFLRNIHVDVMRIMVRTASNVLSSLYDFRILLIFNFQICDLPKRHLGIRHFYQYLPSNNFQVLIHI